MKERPNNSYSFPRRVLITTGIVLSALLLLLLVGYAFKVLLFVLAAILVASFFRGIAKWIRHHAPISGGWALGISVLGVFAIIIIINWLLIPEVVKQAHNLARQFPSAVENARQYLEDHWWGQQLISQIPDNPQKFLTDHAGWALQTFGIFSSTFGILSDIYIIVLIAIFVMINPAPYVNGLVSLVPVSAQSRSREIIYEVYTILQRWLTGKLLSMLIVAILTAIGLFILGMPLVLFLSLLAGALAFIPNFGPIIAIIPAVLVAILQGPSMVLYVIAVYIGVQIVESNLITPFIQREMVYLPLAMIIIAQVVLGILVGGLGLILATPIVAVLMVLIKMVYIEDILHREVDL